MGINPVSYGYSYLFFSYITTELKQLPSLNYFIVLNKLTFLYKKLPNIDIQKTNGSSVTVANNFLSMGFLVATANICTPSPLDILESLWPQL
jgi:hypothetical protein